MNALQGCSSRISHRTGVVVRKERRKDRGRRGGSSWWSAEPLELATGDGNGDPRGTVHTSSLEGAAK